MKRILLLFLFSAILLISVKAQRLHWSKVESNGAYGWWGGNGGSMQNVITDLDGNVYTCGQFSNSIILDSTITLTGDPSATNWTDSYLAKRDRHGKIIWAVALTGDGYEFSNSIARDTAGSIYMIGWYQSSTHIGGVPVQNLGGNQDCFVAKYDKNGNFIFLKNFGGSGWDYPSGICTDPQGNVFIAGSFQNNITFGTINLNGSYGSFLTRLDANGTFVWARLVALSTANYWGGGDVEIDRNGNLYVCGSFQGTTTIGRTTLSSVTQNGYIAKYNPNGGFAIWAQKCGSRANALAIDGNGDVYVAGQLNQDADSFGRLTVPNNIPSLNNWYGGGTFIAKFNPTGNFYWAKKFAKADNQQNNVWTGDMASSMAVDDAGYIYVSGSITGSTDTSSTCLFEVPNYNNNQNFYYGDAYLLKLSPSGDCIWNARSAGNQDYNNQNFNGDWDWGTGVATDNSGAVYWSSLSYNYWWNNNNQVRSVGVYMNNNPVAEDSLPMSNVQNTYSNNFLWAFREHYIEVDTMDQLAYCPGDSIIIPYIKHKSFNPGNVFKAQLSNNVGNFFDAVEIGVIADTASGIIRAVIPISSAPGKGFKVRVSSTDPPLYGYQSFQDIIVRDKPYAQAGNNDTICYGDTVQLHASGGFHYRWQSATNISDDTIATPLVYPGITTDYILKTIDTSHSCYNYDTVKVMVKSLPKVFPRADSTICKGGQVLLSCYGKNGDSLKYSYEWYTATGNTPFSTNDSVVVSPGQSMVYHVVLYDSCAIKRDTAYVSITVRGALQATTRTDTTICKGEFANIYARPMGGNDTVYRYAWYKMADTSLLNHDSSFTMQGDSTISLMLVLEDGCTLRPDTGYFKLTVRAPLEIAPRPDTIICNGRPITLDATPSGGHAPGYAYVWDNGLGTGKTHTFTPLTTATYRVILSDLCTVLPDTGFVTVQVRQPLNLNTRSDTTVCIGEALDLFVNGLGGDSLYYSFSWDNGVGTGNYLKIFPPATTTYRVVLTDNCTLLSTSDAVTITVRDPLSISTSADTTICVANTADLRAYGTGGYAPGYRFVWSNVTKDTTLAPGTPFHATPVNSRIYQVKLIDNCTVTGDSSTILVTVRDSLKITLPSDTLICNGALLPLTANATGGDPANYSYTWNNGLGNAAFHQVQPLSDIQYTVMLNDGCSPADTTSILVTIRQPLQVTKQNDTLVCPFQPVNLVAGAAGGNTTGYTFTWDNGLGTGATKTVKPGTPTTYRITVSDNCSFNATANIFVDISPLPDTAFTTLPDNGCEPLPVDLTSNYAITGGKASWTWEFGDKDVQTITTGNQISHTYLRAGNYQAKLTVTSAYGCTDSSSRHLLEVYPNPIAAFYATPASADILSPVATFVNTSKGAVQYTWDFGDGSGNSSATNPVHTYPDTGYYPVKLTAITNYGCKDETTENYRIKEVFQCYIPTAFTPNSKGENEVFGPVGTAIESYKMLVFDRWGGLIYDSGNTQLPWNGKWNNTSDAVPEGVYSYMITAEIMEGGRKTFKGNVLLIR